jgi:hypothetical protein
MSWLRASRRGWPCVSAMHPPSRCMSACVAVSETRGAGLRRTGVLEGREVDDRPTRYVEVKADHDGATQRRRRRQLEAVDRARLVRADHIVAEDLERGAPGAPHNTTSARR